MVDKITCSKLAIRTFEMSPLTFLEGIDHPWMKVRGSDAPSLSDINS
jgi:hypothetical protein